MMNKFSLLTIIAVLTTVRIPRFSLRLYLDSTIPSQKGRTLESISSQPFGDDSPLTLQVQTYITRVLQSSVFGSNLAYTRIILLSPSTMYKSTGSLNKLWIDSNFTGYASFQGLSPSTTDLASSIIYAFRSLPSDSQFYQGLRSTDSVYLRTVIDANANLLNDSSNPSNSQDMSLATPSKIPYIILGSVLSMALLSLGLLIMYQKRRNVEKIMQEITPTKIKYCEKNYSTESLHLTLKASDQDKELSLPVTITCLSSHNFPPRSSSLECIPEENDEMISACSHSNVVRNEMILYKDISLNHIFNDELKVHHIDDDEESIFDEVETQPPGIHYFQKKAASPATLCSHLGVTNESLTKELPSFVDEDEFFLGVTKEYKPFDEYEGMEVE